MLEIRREAGALDGTQWHAAGAPSGYMTDPVSDAALTGAAFVRHLGDARFASLRALRQLLRALDAERVAIGVLDGSGTRLHEELVWSSGFGRCGESERDMALSRFTDDLAVWQHGTALSLLVDIDVSSEAWQDVPCNQLLLVRGPNHGAGCPVFVAQLRKILNLPEGAAHAISLLLNEYSQRRVAA